MALSIGVKGGTRIWIVDSRVPGAPLHLLTVAQVIAHNRVLVQLDADTPQVITNDQRTKLLPEVYVFCGFDDSHKDSSSRLAFEAPGYWKINRARRVTLQVETILRSEAISPVDLERMLRNSAKCTDPRGNRRYQHWLFDVTPDEVKSMLRMGPSDTERRTVPDSSTQ